ncbi:MULTISPECIES: 4-hydroxy-3-methylbut-2-enyl diphosphate reductase [unclassified Clostridioides]|uniref:4-hydroxy-3-methylbut-2-enyl diphosphate reductase n=1 Tax=unclassified Clostridioides TaxID=2635829 RepID=UPI001D0C5A2B|nr:4-hydroxy-3-methylbut-2-enyl diphosphate reductase [Clostridioides sp. ES-S-0001-02]MCC0642268.1 4-hydroxy-3-methylbut-2-enyl diphosphate reductase [Clostridioides sp. ES-S-0049-03]MCC0653549.1 4-hydroxy-3-methylbut-2-enyl diphosphate reductase [Clostridioides sp. ES-S-0001-03]MCC0655296.1 4-hydroxy-3-methylbut-2-enyl diphosphate reductase [Clostridioides sp. ES-S-0123-01]MCC0671271.1 4-hydroxy-3-methylbut-2-enyl diphosphate reductase [Clostridioides sp. ES-S-0145-01]MCC0674921.1 4-hydroxy-
MNVKIAKNAGFCFGVKRAMKMAWDEVEKNDSGIYALGPLIHNKQAVARYEQKGLKTVDEIDIIPDYENMIIRSHGVPEKVYKEAKNKKLKIVDTTCPFVKKIHTVVSEYHNKGYEIIVIGDMKHPEVIGINGWCENSAIIIKAVEQMENMEFDNSKQYCVVAQTTINPDLYSNIVNKLADKLENIVFNDTICSATKTRQEAAKALAGEVDCMIVIGGKHSSNTQKLVKVCEDLVPTFAIETKDELDVNMLKKYKTLGVTAGASTPDWIIEEVITFIENL